MQEKGLLWKLITTNSFSKGMLELSRPLGMSEQLNKRLESMTIFTRNEMRKVSLGNDFYRWDLDNENIRNAKQILGEFAILALQQKITKDEYKQILYNYFLVVYDETFKQWQWERTLYRVQHEIDNIVLLHLPVECVRLTIRELEFINERWQTWEYREGQKVFDEIDNKVAFDSFDWIEIDNTIYSKNFVINFGKYHWEKQNGRKITIKELFTRDPKYLLWAYNNTD